MEDQEERRHSKETRFHLSRNHNENSENLFRISSIEFGNFEMCGFEISCNSNYVYPHRLKVVGGSIYLTDYEVTYLMCEYLRYSLTTNVNFNAKDSNGSFNIQMTKEKEQKKVG